MPTKPSAERLSVQAAAPTLKFAPPSHLAPFPDRQRGSRPKAASGSRAIGPDLSLHDAAGGDPAAADPGALADELARVAALCSQCALPSVPWLVPLGETIAAAARKLRDTPRDPDGDGDDDAPGGDDPDGDGESAGAAAEDPFDGGESADCALPGAISRLASERIAANAEEPGTKALRPEYEALVNKIREERAHGPRHKADTLSAPEKARRILAQRHFGYRFADPANLRYGLQNASEIRADWNFVHQQRQAALYTPAELKAVKDRIIAAWKRKIDPKGPPSAPSAHAGKPGRPRTRGRTFADPPFDKLPIGTAAEVKASWAALLKPETQQLYNPQVFQAVAAKVIAAWKAMVGPDGPPGMDRLPEPPPPVQDGMTPLGYSSPKSITQ